MLLQLGRTPLHVCAGAAVVKSLEPQKVACIHALIAEGADPVAVDAAGATPSELAFLAGFPAAQLALDRAVMKLRQAAVVGAAVLGGEPGRAHGGVGGVSAPATPVRPPAAAAASADVPFVETAAGAGASAIAIDERSVTPALVAALTERE
jgi:hypothetical protein